MPSKKPTELKRLSGTLRPDRVNLRVPRPPMASKRCPADLPRAAKRHWRRLAPALGDMGLLTVVDLPAFRDMVLCLARLDQAEAEIDRRGVVVEGARGGLVKNPAIAVANQYRQALYKWATKFGLTPVDRGRLETPQDVDTEPTLAELLFKATLRGDGDDQ